MSILTDTIEKIVTANHILSREGVVDGYGHVSLRHPSDPSRYLLSCSRSPELVESGDILEYSLDGTCIDDKGGKKPYAERFIHGAIYKARPDVMSVVHHHAYPVVTFSAMNTPIRPMMHTTGVIGHDIPLWDIRDKFGTATNMLVTDMDQGGDLAKKLGANRMVMMRGHGATAATGTIEESVISSIYLQVAARQQLDALTIGGEINFLSKGEIEQQLLPEVMGIAFPRIWEYFSRRAGR
jgi:ribulose-5-phosphate 4-epimerase/fuculose-1-phosphate aldolase